MRLVVKRDNYDPVKIGIGTERQARALKKFGCNHVFYPHELRQVLEEKKLPTDMFLRPEDTIVMVQPNLIKLDWFRQINSVGVAWQVPGHDPARLKSEEDRREFRKLKPKGPSKKLVKETRGRKAFMYPAPTPEQAAAIVALWRSDAKLASVMRQVQEMMGAEVPRFWVRDLVKKETGSPNRKV